MPSAQLAGLLEIFIIKSLFCQNFGAIKINVQLGSAIMTSLKASVAPLLKTSISPVVTL